MVHLAILTGKKAGTDCVARRFPFQVGRSSAAHLCVEDAGVWDRHLQIDLQPREGFVLSVHPDAFASVNGQTIQQAVLRNGDLIECGSVQLRFGLSPTRQRSLRWRESLMWVGLALLCFSQIALIYWLLG